MNNTVMRRVNAALLGIVVLLALALTGVNTSRVTAQTGGTADPPGFSPGTPGISGCQPVIQETNSCGSGCTIWMGPRLTCKTTYADGIAYCCTYNYWDKYCNDCGGGSPGHAGFKEAFVSETTHFDYCAYGNGCGYLV